MHFTYKELMDAFEFVNSNPDYMNQAFLDLETGKIHWHSDLHEIDGDLPEDLDDDRYIEIPDKRDLGLGRDLVLDFADRYLPDEAEQVETIFRRRGAYGRFKALLEKKGALQKWYDFESRAEEMALRLWCQENGIEIREEE
jgi:hypothetical protein